MGIVNRLKQVKFEEDLVGIAASQIGSTAPICLVLDWVFREPEITWRSPETDDAVEHCWSVEGGYLVSRSTSCRVRYRNINGKWKEKTLVGFAARVAQHEIDHLTDVSSEKPYGITIADRGELVC